MRIHPKTSGAALGGSLGVTLVAVLSSFHDIHLTSAAAAAIPTFLSTLGAWLSPTGDNSTTTRDSLWIDKQN